MVKSSIDQDTPLSDIIQWLVDGMGVYERQAWIEQIVEDNWDVAEFIEKYECNQWIMQKAEEKDPSVYYPPQRPAPIAFEEER